ncbi:uncharacterized protein J3D65DRAFT_675579 [Phyllosticta citribraziliensis]|uniref:Uncharacterized protein n=1 Tax=Phyllosticta citribraziliensis TaxID=989973 RepID=A0ABR1LW52_9PEZI
MPPKIKQEIKDEEVETSFTAINAPAHEDSKDVATSVKRSASDVDERVASPAKRTKGRLTPEPTEEDLLTPARQRKPPKKNPSTPKTIGASLDQLDPLDLKLVQMKDSGYGWKDIGKMWTEATGEVTAKSTLPNRYARIKANIMTLPEDEQRKLVEAIAWVEEDYEKTKWERISQRMQEQGVETKYAISILQKQYQKMMAAAAPALDKAGTPE